MIFDILEAKIQDAGLGVPGQSLFRSYMPSNTGVAVMTRVPLEGLSIDPLMPGRYKGRIQVITRHSDPVAGYKLATDVADVLQVQGFEEHPATADRGAATISLFIGETLPIEFPRLESDMIEWSQHFNVVFTLDRT